ncbi:MAG: DMT family transporter [Symploca sp. SIO1C2]|nr:DMT family transporter [Symploca sp. SIO1C2]
MSTEVDLPKEQLTSKKVNLAIAALFLAVFAMSWTPILIRWSVREVSPVVTIFWREAIAFIPLGLWVNFKRLSAQESSEEPPYKLDKSTKFLLVAASIVVSCCALLYTVAITQTSVANSAVIRSLVPLFTTIPAWLIFRQSFGYQFIIGMFLSIGGAITIGLEDSQISLHNLQGDVISLISAMFYAGYLLIVEKLRTQVDTTTILLWRVIVGMVLLLPVILITRDPIFPASINGWLSVITLALLGQIIGQGSVAYSLNKLSSGLVAVTLLLVPAISAIIAWLIFAENLSLLNWLSLFVILLGIYLAVSSKEAVKTIQN